jgi:predicted PurR-regulated permease PerM
MKKVKINNSCREKWFESRIGFMILAGGTVVSMMWAIFGPITAIQKDIAVIQNNIVNINQNHETHIQDLTQSIKDIEKEQTIMMKTITENQTFIKTYLGIK